MAIHLVRHADAGHRSRSDADEERRGLTARGCAQAVALAERFADLPVSEVLSSRYARCVQTVEPLAHRLDIEVVLHDALAEEADLEEAWALMCSLADHEVVLCSHGNIIGPLLDRIRRRGTEIVADQWTCEKGSVWRIDTDDSGSFARAVQTLAHP